ncbi:MAG TPA: ABC transporter permease [Thermoanaerobaculia bacterium]|nr:ABC transporter permease [Thermoanaerobaculia bacterium]
MPFWRQLARGLHTLVHRPEADREIADEVAHYLEETVAAHAARGLSPDEARRAARRELGNPLSVREEVRGYGWENRVEALAADLRYAARRLRAAPGSTAVTVLTLAIGIGATTAIFSAIEPILLEPLPYPDPDRIAMIREVAADGSPIDGTFGMYRELAERALSFETIAVFKPWRPTITGSDRPERVEAQQVSARYFDVLGVPPALGRSFEPAEDRRGGPDVVVLSDRLWRRRFGADPAILGRAITLDETPVVVLGVMPRGFENLPAPAAELWAPLQYDLSQGRAWGHHLGTIGKLNPGAGAERAADELDGLGQAVLDEQHPETYGSEVRFRVVPLQEDVTRGVRPALVAILGAVVLVLAIACVNVTNLLLARGVHRRGELALRTALGAPRGRLVRQLLTESLLLAALGGAAGMALAILGTQWLVALSPPGLPRVDAIRVDASVLGFGLGLTTLIGLALGSIPALRAARGDQYPDLQLQARRTAGGNRRARGALVVAEVAFAVVVLVSAGLLLRSVERLLGVAPGFDPAGLLTMQVQVSGHRFDDDGETRRFFARVLDAVHEAPGVEAAALTSQLPLAGDDDRYGVHFDPPPAVSPGTDPAEDRGTFRYAVSPGYFEAMSIPLRRGRRLDGFDGAGAPPVALISESLARRRLPGVEPIGQRLHVGPQEGLPYTVVGVVGDVKQESLAVDEATAVYITPEQWHFADRAMSLVVRGPGDPGALAPAVREAVWAVDEDQPIVRVATMADLVSASAADRRFALALFQAFALAALALAAAGIYGVLSGSVVERTREIGVRSALGASRREVLALVVGQGARLTGLGVVIGAAAAAAASEGVAAMLFGVSRFDPATYLGVITLLAGVAAVACAVPAWRAVRVDPATTLRAE